MVKGKQLDVDNGEKWSGVWLSVKVRDGPGGGDGGFRFSFYISFFLFLGKPPWFCSVPSVLYSFAFLCPSDCRIMEYFQNEDLEYVVDDFYNLDDFEHDDPFAGASRFQTVFFFFYLFQIFYVPNLRHQDGPWRVDVLSFSSCTSEASVIRAKGWEMIARSEMLTNGEGVDHVSSKLVNDVIHFVLTGVLTIGEGKCLSV
ncbi:hypothetical protein V6N12_028634 [Hibiscus sabdariffa]|uniref:Uncharacterized protein n=1 Tax=Hibiscus sabdariffa TaxID=183260 RepID=A0ABR2F6G3_9ROSI